MKPSLTPRRFALGSPALAGLLALALSACGTAPLGMRGAPAAPNAPLSTPVQPNPNLYAEGIAPIAQALAARTAAYNEFVGHSLVAWHPTRREMLISTRAAGGNTTQLFWLKAPGAQSEQLTQFKEPVRRATFEPRQGEFIVFERDEGGSEAGQLYRLDLASRRVTALTDPAQKHSFSRWTHHSGELLVSSVPLDRTAAAGTRSRVQTTWTLLNPLKPASRRQLAVLEGGGWGAVAFSPDDRQLVAGRYISANESQVWVFDVASGQGRQLLPRPGETGATVQASQWPLRYSPDGRRLLIATDRDGEFRELQWLDLGSGAMTPITRHIAWDVGSTSQSERLNQLAATVNADGRSELHLFDLTSGRELPRPTNLPAGSVHNPTYRKATGELALVVNNAQSPSDIWTLHPGTGRVERWTTAPAVAGVDPSAFQSDRIIRWKSFDGRSISGLMTLPPAHRFPGKRPVLINIHGGPEGQATSGFLGRTNYYINELGVAVIHPNVRGSSGFGKTFLSLDNGPLREDSVKDIGALLDWIATQPNLDASRVLVAGGSYGGYMSLAVSTHYADRIRGAIDVVGISHFVTFLESTESYRRDLRRVEYGDERDPAMREFLHRISPLTNAHRITQPLFVVQGKNDPRVPVTEAEQIVARARANGNPMVWYLRGENEGHGFARKDNSDFLFWATVAFMQQTILKP